MYDVSGPIIGKTRFINRRHCLYPSALIAPLLHGTVGCHAIAARTVRVDPGPAGAEPRNAVATCANTEGSVIGAVAETRDTARVAVRIAGVPVHRIVARALAPHAGT